MLEVLRRRAALCWLGAAAGLLGMGELCGGLSLLGSGSVAVLEAGLYVRALGYGVACGTLLGTAWAVVVEAGADVGLAAPRTVGGTAGVVQGLAVGPLGVVWDRASERVPELVGAAGAVALVALGSLLEAFGSLGAGSAVLVDAGALLGALGFGAAGVLVGSWSVRLTEGPARPRFGPKASDLVVVASGGLWLLAAGFGLQGAWLAATPGKFAAIAFGEGLANGALGGAVFAWALRRHGQPQTLGLAALGLCVAGLGDLLAGFGLVGSEKALVVTGEEIGALGLGLLSAAAFVHGLRLGRVPTRRAGSSAAGFWTWGWRHGGPVGSCVHCGAPSVPAARVCSVCGWPSGSTSLANPPARTRP